MTRILIGDCRAQMRTLDERSVHAIITSPPYWGLRDYGTADWIDGDPDCDHVKPFVPRADRASGNSRIGQGGTYNDAQDVGRSAYRDECGKCGAIRVEPTVWGGDPEHEHAFGESIERRRTNGGEREYGSYDGGVGRSVQPILTTSSTCSCGAWRGQLGLEPTPEMYVEHLVEVFAEARRVLRDDGTLWLNLGDTYWGGKGQSGSGGKEYQQRRAETGVSFSSPEAHVGGPGRTKPQDGRHSIIKNKDLVGIPWMVAFALRADGWWLRSDVVWNKPNAMPESVEDRPTRSHEFMFMLTKSARYFYDYIAVQEQALYEEWPGIGPQHAAERQRGEEYRPMRTAMPKGSFDGKWGDSAFRAINGKRNKRDVWTISTEPYPGAHFAVFPPKLVEPCIMASTSQRGVCPICATPWERIVERVKHPERDVEAQRAENAERTGRTDGQVAGPEGMVDEVRTVGWQPACAHYTGMPPKLVEPAIMASTSEAGACPECGAPYRRLTKRTVPDDPGRGDDSKLRDADGLSERAASTAQRKLGQAYQDQLNEHPVETVGWEPTCEHIAPATPAVVMDPFGGSGTVAQVAQSLMRDSIIIELAEKHRVLIEGRVIPTPLAGRALVGDKPISLWGEPDPVPAEPLPGRHQAQGATSLRSGRSNVEAQRNDQLRPSQGAADMPLTGPTTRMRPHT